MLLNKILLIFIYKNYISFGDHSSIFPIPYAFIGLIYIHKLLLLLLEVVVCVLWRFAQLYISGDILKLKHDSEVNWKFRLLITCNNYNN